MNEHRRNWLYIGMGLNFIISGIALVFFPLTFIESVSTLISLVIAVTGLARIFQAALHSRQYPSQRDRWWSFIIGIGQVILALWVWYYTEETLFRLLNFIGYYQLLMGLISIISYGLLVKDKVKRRFNRLTFGLLHLLLAFFSFTAHDNGRNVMLILGIHAVLIGLTYINDGRGNFIRPEAEKQFKRKFRFPLPIVFNALLPTKLLQKVNLFLEGELDIDGDIEQQKSLIDDANNDELTLIQILIHVGSNELDFIGHMNIVYKDKVYSYGNHDVDSRHLFDATGDGILVLVDKSDYIDFSIKNGDNLVVEYDVALNKEQTNALEKKIQELNHLLIPWRPSTPSQLESYGGELLRAIPEAEFFKFNSGKFKTYFVMGTNCVMLSDELIGTSGLDLFMFVGILTPGTYYDYLEKEFHKANSIVISRTVHHQGLNKYLAGDFES